MGPGRSRAPMRLLSLMTVTVAVGGRHVDGGHERLLVVSDLAVRLRRTAQLRRSAGCPRVRTQEQILRAGVRPDRIGLVAGREPDVVAIELAAAGPSNCVGAGIELEVTRICPKWVRSVAPGQAEVRGAGRLVVAVLAVVVVDRELAVTGEGGPLPVLVGSVLPGRLRNDLFLARIGRCAGERCPAVARNAQQDLVVARPRRLDPDVCV